MSTKTQPVHKPSHEYTAAKCAQPPPVHTPSHESLPANNTSHEHIGPVMSTQGHKAHRPRVHRRTQGPRRPLNRSPGPSHGRRALHPSKSGIAPFPVAWAFPRSPVAIARTHVVQGAGVMATHCTYDTLRSCAHTVYPGRQRSCPHTEAPAHPMRQQPHVHPHSQYSQPVVSTGPPGGAALVPLLSAYPLPHSV